MNTLKQIRTPYKKKRYIHLLMPLTDRHIGSELSVVERELIFNDKYANVGFVKYDTKDGDYFFLNPSPFLKTFKNEIYHTSGHPPPENQFVEVNVIDERTVILHRSARKNINVKEVDSWKLFDLTPLVQRRKILDFEEVIEYFTYPLTGDTEVVEEVAGCSSLFAFSSPPIEDDTGGIKSAIFGKNYQWDLFRKPLRVIPDDFRKTSSDYYYYISKIERDLNKSRGEMNLAILRPEKLISDIPISFESVSERKYSRDYHALLSKESGVITAYILDALLLKPQYSDKVEEMMLDAIYELREEYYSSGQRPYLQNIGDAVPKLASSYARLKASLDIKSEYVKYVTDLWTSMFRKAAKIPLYPGRVSDFFLVTGDARKVYFKLYDVFAADYWIPIIEAIEAVAMDPVDFELSVDALVERGYCVRKGGHIMLLDPYKQN